MEGGEGGGWMDGWTERKQRQTKKKKDGKRFEKRK